MASPNVTRYARLRLSAASRAVGGVGLSLAAVILLAACGGEPADQSQSNPGAPPPTEAVISNAEFTEGASPAALASPETRDQPVDVHTLTATIVDGRLDPDPLEGMVDESYVLTITGDGAEHTLAIADLVTETSIAAAGETEVDFTISGEPGDRDITLDGEPAGALRVTSASGLSD